MALNIIVLAAGQGTRMKSHLPKVLHQLAGKPLLEHVVSTAKTLNPEKIAVIYGHGGECVREHFSSISLEWAEQKELLGTGHAVMQALPLLDDHAQVLILCGDVPLISKGTLLKLIESAGENEIAWLTAKMDNPYGFGRIVRDCHGAPLAIVEEKDASQTERAINEINTGISVIPAQYLKKWLPLLKNHNSQGEYYLTDLFGAAIHEGVNLHTVTTDDAWEVMGINDKVQLAMMERHFQAAKAKRYMQAGLSLLDPARFDVRGELTFGQNVTIDVNVIIEGNVLVGSNCYIGPNVILKDVIISDNVVIKANTIVEGAKIGPECELGPFARVRPGTELARKAKLGNFVETKKTFLGEGSKVNHLSYIGDAYVGKHVNIGAGTITCNYDGVNKHKTDIGDEAFIGSNTQLVAPVRVGKGATIGAGSTITMNVPEGELTLARARQVTIEGWKRPIKKKA